MWDRIRGSRSESTGHLAGVISRPGRRANLQPLVEGLEDRQLLTSATLQPLSNLTVPAQQGYTLPLLANFGNFLGWVEHQYFVYFVLQFFNFISLTVN